MKISEREKIILSIVLAIGVGYSYYQFAYTPQAKLIEDKKLELETLETDYNDKKIKIALTPQNEKDIKKLNLSIEEVSKNIYPDLWQPKLIKELSELRTKANININFSYTQPTYAPISKYFTSKEEEKEITNSLDSLIDEYNKKMPKDQAIEYKKEEETAAKKKDEKAKEETSINVQQMKVTASFTGRYENVLKFIKLVEDYKYLVAIPDISIAPSGNGEVSGSLSMEFYSAPRIDGDFDKYYDWKAEGTKGKKNPFDDFYTSSISSITTKKADNSDEDEDIDTASYEEEEEEDYSISMTVRPSNSDMAAMTLGKSNGISKKGFLYQDENKVVEATVEFTKVSGTYYVKYKLGDEVYPTTGNGIECNPKGNLKMLVNSAKRKTTDDMVAVKLNVKNNTDKKVEVEIKDDDKQNPRIKMRTEGNVYYISK